MDVRAIFGISAFMTFVGAIVAAWLYVWPWLKSMEKDRALAVLVAPHMFLRAIGLSFLVPGVVSPALPSAFAVPAAYGDLVAAILAIGTAIALAKKSPAAYAAVWFFNLWGAADLLFAFYRALSAQLKPGDLGPTYFMVTVLVPALLLTHVLIFGLLLSRTAAAAADC
jgi:hypothetical protein